MVGPAATGAGTKVDVTLKLPQLQNLCKRDPEGYREDYDAQIRRLESELGILALQPETEPSKSLLELIQFAAAVSSSSYKGEESQRIAGILLNLLVGSSGPVSSEAKSSSVENVSTMPTAALQLHREVRKSCVSALILMRNKGAVKPLLLLEPFFRIMATVPDKGLRTQLYKHIVNDIRNLNKNGRRDEKVNRAIQSFLHRVVNSHGTAESAEESATDVAAKRATDMVCELYRRRVWTDERTVAILAASVESKNTTVMSRAIRFFLGIEEKMVEDTKKQVQDKVDEKDVIDFHQYSKKTKAHARQTERQVKNKKKLIRKKEEAEWTDITPEDDKGVEACKKLFPAIELLRDPQGLAESVFKRLRNAGSIKYDTKLLMVNFITRLVGNHQLLILPLYPYLQKYMGGQQRNVTALLAYTVQACHEYVPPDEVYGILKTIAHNFIAERCSEEQIAVGINAARAICSRVPAVLSIEESSDSQGVTSIDVEAFARDLAAFAKHRDRSVSISGKGWTNFVRETYPGLLQGKHRGLKGAALHKAGAKPLRYGQTKVASGVEGADLLAEYESKKAARKKNGAAQEDSDSSADEWEEASEDGEGKEGEEKEWEDVSEEEEGKEGEDEEDDGWEEASDQEEGKEGEDEDDGWEDVSEEDEKSVDNDGEGEEAPALVNLDKASTKGAESPLDLSKMTHEEREKLKQELSSNRIFTAREFEKMKKLVERENRAKRDPREAARRKRAAARGEEFDELSDDDSNSDNEERINIAGAVNPEDIMANSKKKRLNREERIGKTLAARAKFEAQKREGGSTNVEKKRTKNFVMSKYSFENRKKGNEKGNLSKKRKGAPKQLNHEAKKRRRKL